MDVIADEHGLTIVSGRDGHKQRGDESLERQNFD